MDGSFSSLVTLRIIGVGMRSEKIRFIWVYIKMCVIDLSATGLLTREILWAQFTCSCFYSKGDAFALRDCGPRSCSRTACGRPETQNQTMLIEGQSNNFAQNIKTLLNVNNISLNAKKFEQIITFIMTVLFNIDQTIKNWEILLPN